MPILLNKEKQLIETANEAIGEQFKFVAYVIQSSTSKEFISTYRFTNGIQFIGWSRSPEGAKRFGKLSKARQVSENMKETRIHILFESDQKFGVIFLC